MNTKWMKAELHNHTIHSDGRQTPTQVVELFAGQGVKVMAISDHNSITGQPEFIQACQAHGVIPVPANEISTFWGHILGMGITRYIDWSVYSPEDSEMICDEIHSQGAICGMAHPFRLGFPVNTGCNWLMKMSDYSRFDYIEVMNTSDKGRCLNHVAIDFWLDLLRSGIRTTALAGKDWHGRPGDESAFCSYLMLDNCDPIEAVRRGFVYISSCGYVDVRAENSRSQSAVIGESIEASDGQLLFGLTFAADQPFSENVLIEIHDKDGLAFLYRRPWQKEITITSGPLKDFAVLKIIAGENDFANLLYLSNPINILK